MANQAKVRLTRVISQAVGLVDRPANERLFLVRKSDTMADPTAESGAPTVAESPDAGAPAAVSAAPISMPAAVKDGLSQGLAAILDTISKVAEMISSATVDDAAEVPTEPLFMLDQAAGDLDALADKFIMDEEMAEVEMAAPPKPDAPADAPIVKSLAPVTKAKVKADAGPPRRQARLIAKKRLNTMKSIHKMMGDGHGTMAKGMGDMEGLMKELAGEMGAGEKAKPPVEAPEDAAKALKGIVDGALAPLLSQVAGLEAALKARPAAAAPTLPNAALPEGDIVPAPAPREQTFQEKLKAAKAACKT